VPQQIRPAEVVERMKQGEKLWFLDVRQPWENQIAQIPGSVLIPLNELASRIAEVKAVAGQTIIAYCHAGMRSLNAAAFLEQNGVPNVLSLAGGIEAWSLQIDPKVPRY
jgi:rhodanese-related sulfurtransferase